MNNILRDNTENQNNQYQLKHWDQPSPQYNHHEPEINNVEDEEPEPEDLLKIMNKENYNHGNNK